jgi:hypothetical protein
MTEKLLDNFFEKVSFKDFNVAFNKKDIDECTNLIIEYSKIYDTNRDIACYNNGYEYEICKNSFRFVEVKNEVVNNRTKYNTKKNLNTAIRLMNEYLDEIIENIDTLYERDKIC